MTGGDRHDPGSEGARVAGDVAAALGARGTDWAELGGGEVGEVYRVDLADGRRVVGKVSPTQLDEEAFMLRYLGARGLPVPDVLAADPDLLVLSFVAGDGDLTPAVERDVARHLPALHDHSADAYGFERDTPSGVLVQPNPWTDHWPTFFREHRLRWSLEVARERDPPPGSSAAGDVVPDDLATRVSSLAADLEEYLPADPAPALLHGDVWANNLVVDGDSVAGFLDPACYYGHAEVELAYATWAGLGEPFLAGYDDRRGVAPGFERRRDLYLLPERLLHAWYFDPAEYLPAVDETLADFGY